MDTYKQKISTANRVKNNKEFEFDHVTTQAFMLPVPIAIRECVPNQKLSLRLQSFCRLNPLVKPTFGRARVHNRAFFVPFRTIMPYYTQFLESEPIYSLVDGQYGLQTSTPIVTNAVLLDAITRVCTSGTSTDYDFCYLDASNVVQYMKWTFVAKFFLKVLISLGYKINYNVNDTESFSALPLLAYVKVLIDWYYPNQYINSTAVQALTPLFQNDSLTGLVLTSSQVQNCLLLCTYCAYDDYVLVDAWDRPVAPNNGAESAYSIPDITMPYNELIGNGVYSRDSGVTNNSGNQTPLPFQNTASNPSGPVTGSNKVWSITQYQHDILKALTDYTTRHRLAGVRAVDRYFAEYGINLSSEIMKRSILLGDDSFNIQFGDVMAHSDTFDSVSGDGAILGDYAGKGIGLGNHQFGYQLGNEFGYIIVMNSVIPQVGYYQGVNPIVKHKSILDFWHADFDGLGVQAIAADEVFVNDDYNAQLSTSAIHSKVFGFAPRYYEYKTAPSVVSGDFSLPNATKDLKSMFLMRDLKGNYTQVSDIEHNVNFCVGVDSMQYNKIFYNDGGGKDLPDNFLFIHHFEVEQTDETSPLYDTYDFKETIRQIDMHTQGAKVN